MAGVIPFMEVASIGFNARIPLKCWLPWARQAEQEQDQQLAGRGLTESYREFRGVVVLPFPSVTELIPVLQVAIGPVILISGVGLLMLSMTNRLGRVIDRARILDRELRPGSPEDPHRNREQLRILIDRARLLRMAIVLASVSVLLAACLIISLFLATLLKLNAGALILVQFVGCLGCLICSMVEFIRDINLSLAAMKLEVCDSLRPAGNQETPSIP